MLIYKKPRPHGCILNIPLISVTTNKKQTIAYWARLLITHSSEIIPLNSDTNLRSQLKNSCFRGSNHLETTKALRPRRRALIRFLVFGTPDKKLAFVFDLLLQTPENWNDINLRPYLLQLEHGRQENSLKPATHLDILYADCTVYCKNNKLKLKRVVVRPQTVEIDWILLQQSRTDQGLGRFRRFSIFLWSPAIAKFNALENGRLCSNNKWVAQGSPPFRFRQLKA